MTHRPGDEILVRELHFDHLSMTSGVVLRSALAATAGGATGMRPGGGIHGIPCSYNMQIAMIAEISGGSSFTKDGVSNVFKT